MLAIDQIKKAALHQVKVKRARILLLTVRRVSGTMEDRIEFAYCLVAQSTCSHTEVVRTGP